MYRWLYSLLFYLLTPLFIIRLLILSRKEKYYRYNLKERFGFIKTNNIQKKIIWLHAVSLGETIASSVLVAALQKEYPNYKIWITSTTASGLLQVNKIHGKSVASSFICYDLPGSVNRFVKRLKPSILILFETEIWPNLITCCYQKNIPIVLANARMSSKSTKNYQKASGLFTPIFTKLSAIIAQDQYSATRLAKLAANTDKITIAGNLKFDIELDAQKITAGYELKNDWQKIQPKLRILTAASTHEGEEQQILSAFKLLKYKHPNLILLLIPRHKPRFDKVYLLAKQQFITTRYSLSNQITTTTEVILGDTIGDMITFLALSDIVFMGGSLVPIGGHNILEPAKLGIPTIIGNYSFNFEFICKSMLSVEGLIKITNLTELTNAIIELLTDSNKHKHISDNALQFIENNQGALTKHLRIINNLLEYQHEKI